MSNIEIQNRCRDYEEPYVGMPIRGIMDYDCHKCPKPEYMKPEYSKPECNQSVCNSVDVCPLAMAYVPWQRWCETYAPAEGHHRGTIFPELDLPFLGGGAC